MQKLPNNMTTLLANERLTSVIRERWNTNFGRCVVRVTAGKGIRVDEMNGEVVVSAIQQDGSDETTDDDDTETPPAPVPTPEEPGGGGASLFGEVIGNSATITDAKWVYGVRLGTYTSSGAWTLQTGAAGTVTAYNTIETNNTSGTVKGGDGVPIPPVAGVLTRLPVGGSSTLQPPVVPLFRSPDGGYFFCVPNPFLTECE